MTTSSVGVGRKKANAMKLGPAKPKRIPGVDWRGKDNVQPDGDVPKSPPKKGKKETRKGK